MKQPRKKPTPTSETTRENAELRARLAEAQARLAEAEETLEAIRSGAVDALVVSGPQGEQVFTLKGAETPYRLLVEAMHESALLLDSERLIVYSNNRLSGMLHCSPGMLLGKPLSEFIAPEQAPQLDRLLAGLPPEGRTAEFWLRPQNPLAKPVPVQLAARPLNLDGLTGTVVVTTDLTAQKAYEARLHEANRSLEERVQQRTADLTRANAQLRESESRLALSLEAAELGMWAWDVTAARGTVSPQNQRLFGLPETNTEPATADYAALIHPEDAERVTRDFLAASRGEQTYDIEYRICRPDGTVRWIHSFGRLLPGQGRLVGVSHDITGRKQAEQVLREKESYAKAVEAAQAERQRFLDVLDTLPVVIDIIRADHRVEWSNRACREAFGDTQGQLCHQSQFHRETPCQECQAFIPLNTGQPHHWEWTLPNGRTFDIYNFPFTAADGSPAVLEMDIDITEIKQAQAQLKAANETLERRVLERTQELCESEAKAKAHADELAALMDAVPAITFIAHDPECRHMTSSRATRELLRLPAGANTSKSAPADERPLTFTPLKDGHPIPPEELPVQRAASTGHETRDFELTLAFNDGTSRDILGNAVPLFAPDGRVRGAVGAFMDITERKRAEEALREQQRRLTLAMEAGQLVPWEIDLLTGQVKQSPRLFQLFGLGPNDTFNFRDQWRTLIHEDDRPAIFQSVEAAKTGQEHHLEYRIHHPDGRIHWHETHGLPIPDTQGRYVRLVGFTRDITERKEFQAELERLVAQRTAKLHELVGELEHFSYTITHDMRSPLRSMRGFAELVQELCAPCQHSEQKALLGRIVASAERMDLLITDALNYSKAVRQELPLGPVDLDTLLHGMLDSYPEFQSANAHIRLEGRIPVVLGNQAGLTQVFSNLLGNAIKFVKPGQVPEIRIRAETLPSPGTTSATAPGGPSGSIPPSPCVRVWVEDNGIGISASMLRRVFNMFARGTNDHEGSGIGLALVRKVVDRMGGRVGVQSEEGQGSRFWVELPAGDVSQAAVVPTPPPGPGAIL